jgi:multisubunit Na+/H+ antiporter MnhB subunit
VTTLEPPRRPVRARRRRRDTIGRVVLVVVGLALAFLFGIAFAQTLDDRPKSSGTETIVRTLTPLPQDAPGRTVTVTVTATNP